MKCGRFDHWVRVVCHIVLQECSVWAEGALVNIDGNDSERLAVVLGETLSESVDPDRSSQTAGYRYIAPALQLLCGLTGV